jgi:DNA polymerase IV
MDLRSLFVDFNAFFASVEQQEQPQLRGRPVAVVPVLSMNSCCIAASYEAKKHGVKTGTLVHEAQKLCPGIRLVCARPAVYVRYHHRLVELVNQCIPVAFIGSIDEMACELIGRERQRDRAVAIARAIKAKFAEHTPFIKASIGIAPNHFLAKTATDMQKPDGLTVIERHDLPHILHSLELRELCGIGRAMEMRLHQQDIFTVAQLCDAPVKRLHSVWGSIEGDRYYKKLRGEFLPENAPHAKSSISHSHVLAPELRNPDSAGAQEAAAESRDAHAHRPAGDPQPAGEDQIPGWPELARKLPLQRHRRQPCAAETPQRASRAAPETRQAAGGVCGAVEPVRARGNHR